MSSKRSEPLKKDDKEGTMSRKSSTLSTVSSLTSTVKSVATKGTRTSGTANRKPASLRPKKGSVKGKVDEKSIEEIVIACEPCSRKSTEVESGGFCLECSENLCADCIEYHKTLKITENHTIVDGKTHDNDGTISMVSMLSESERLSNYLQTPTVTYHSHNHNSEQRAYKFVATEKCVIHDEKLIELFCEDDMELICSVCAGTAHRRCKSVLYIPKAAEGIRKDKRCREVKEQLAGLKLKFGKLIKEKQKNIWSYEKQRESALKSVAQFRENMDKLLDDLQTSMEDEIEEKFLKGKNVYEGNLKQCEETVTEIHKRLLKLEDDIRKNDEAKIFMDLKIYDDDVKSFTAKYDQEANATGFKLNVIIDDTLKDMVKREHLIRSVTYGQPIITGDYKLKMNIHGLAMLPEGRVIVHDNENLVLLNENLTVNEYSKNFQTPGQPNAICAIDNNTVAVTMHKMKQVIILNCRHDLEEKVTFNLRSKSVSNGLAGFEEHLYCLCRADNDELTACPRTAIYIYDLTGEKQMATDFKYHFQVHINPFKTKEKMHILFVWFWFFTPHSTAMAMSGRSFYLTTIVSWASLTKRLTSTLCTYFCL